MIKIIWNDKVVELENVNGLTVREAILSKKEDFPNISINDCPMRVLKRHDVTRIPVSCIQLTWDNRVYDEDEIEFFIPGGVKDLQKMGL